MAGMALPQHPARVQVTVRGGEPRWLADPPYASAAEGGRWRLVEDVADAGIWPWQRSLSLEREARQPWRGQLARAIAVEERAAVAAEARVRALGCDIPDAEQVRYMVFGPGRVLVGWAGGRRELLPAIAEVPG